MLDNDLKQKVFDVLDTSYKYYKGDIRKTASAASPSIPQHQLYADVIIAKNLDDGSKITVPVFNDIIDEYKKLKETQVSSKEKPILTEREFWQITTMCFDYGTGDQIRVKKIPSWDEFIFEGMEGQEITRAEMTTSLTKMLYKAQQTRTVEYAPIILNDIDRVLEKARRDSSKSILQQIKYTGENNALEQLLEAYEVENSHHAATIIRQFIWQIKRAMMGLESRYQVFPVLCGIHHGTGKTTMIKKLMSPLGGFVIDYNLHKIKEERVIAVTSNRYYALVFDEMSGASKADISELKHWVTSERLTYRKMGLNIDESLEKKASGIGSANDRLSTLITDSTGNRRFVEIHIMVDKRPKLVELPEWNIDGSKWLEIWKSVDEENKLGYFRPDENTEIAKYVQGQINETIELLWLKETYCFDYNMQPNGKIVTLKQADVYEDYVRYCKKFNNGSHMGKKNWSRTMTALNAQFNNSLFTMHRKNDGMYYDLPLHIDSQVQYTDVTQTFTSIKKDNLFDLLSVTQKNESDDDESFDKF